MAYNVTNLKSDMAGALHGTSVNQITNLYGLLFRAASELLSDIDPEETRRTLGLTTPVYGQVYEYACPSDLKGNRLIDLRPYVNRLAGDRTSQFYSSDFDRMKEGIKGGSMIETRWNTGVKTLRISVPASDNIVIDTMDDIGTWVNGGGAGTITLDSVNFAQGSASLKYNLTGSGYLYNPSLSSDLSAIENEGVLFCWVWSPAILPTSHTLRWGTDASNYWEVTVAGSWDGTAYIEGWNQLGFDWSAATKTGTPSSSTVNYAYLYTNQTGSATPVRLDYLMAAPGKMFELEYYSKCLFRDGIYGTFKERPTTDSDRVNLDTDSYMLYFNKVMRLAIQQLQGSDGASDAKTFDELYQEGLKNYRGKYPSQAQKAQTTYYGVKRRSPSAMVGTRLLRP